MYGLPYGFTVYGGAIFSDNYYSLAGGLGKNFGYIGAISIDVTCAKSKLANEENSEGQSYRFLYSKSFNSGTDFRLLGYKYSTSGYYTFQKRRMCAAMRTALIASTTNVVRFRAT